MTATNQQYINRIRAHREALERNIAAAVDAYIKEFVSATGANISSVSVGMIGTRALRMHDIRNDTYAVGRVDVTIIL